MVVGFGETELCLLLSLATGQGKCAGRVYYWAGNGSWGKSRLYVLGGVAVTSWLAMVQVEMGTGYCQYCVFEFAMAVELATLRCGLFWFNCLRTYGVWAWTIPGYGLVVGSSVDCRSWSVGKLLAGWL